MSSSDEAEFGEEERQEEEYEEGEEEDSDDDDLPIAKLKKVNGDQNGYAGHDVVKDDDIEEGEEEEEWNDDGDEEEKVGRKRNARHAKGYYEEADDDDDDDDEDDVPLSKLKSSSPKKKAKTSSRTATNGKTKSKKKESESKKKDSKKESSSSSARTTNGDSYTSTSDALYRSECTKGMLIQRLLCRWWYCMTWPDPSRIPDEPPENYDSLDGFPGVYVCTRGEKVGHILDLRDNENRPSFENFAKKSSAELVDLLLAALEEQRRVLVEADGKGTPTEKEIDGMVKWAKRIKDSSSKADKADKEAIKILKAARLKLA